MENTKKRIILIDDDDTTNYLNRMIIEKSNTVDEIISFEGGSEALDYFKSKTNEDEGSLVLLDINMPVMNGWEFLDHFVELNGKLASSKIILLTSSINPHDKQKAEENKRVAALKAKPLSIKMVSELVNDYLN